jgi:hypothetical protein
VQVEPGTRLELAYYRLADARLVTPLSDGMNLVAKEFVTAQGATGGAGALVLNEFTGSAEEFGRGALLRNPFDVDGLAATIEPDDDPKSRAEARVTYVSLEGDGHAVLAPPTFDSPGGGGLGRSARAVLAALG